MHVNREIVDQVVAAALVLLTLAVAERHSKRLAILLGAVAGLSMLGNTRLVFMPILCVAYLVWRLPRTRLAVSIAALVLAASAVAVAPWLVRTRAEVGCWTLTTDGRAMWKANNAQTYGLLSSGQWIDDVKDPPRPKPPNRDTPEEAYGYVTKSPPRPDVAYRVYPNECVAMRFYEHKTFQYWLHEPHDKAKLAALSLKLLWQPSAVETTGRPGAGTGLDVGRRVIEPIYMWALYALAAVGLFVAPRRFVVLALSVLAYQSACAMVFVGATRYRIAWDFLLAVLAAAALGRAAEWLRVGRKHL
jgi:hypothetical protein